MLDAVKRSIISQVFEVVKITSSQISHSMATFGAAYSATEAIREFLLIVLLPGGDDYDRRIFMS